MKAVCYKEMSLFMKLLLMLCLIFIVPDISTAGKMTSPQDYGKVIINNYSDDAGLAPVVFEHWLHRAMFTCRLCHVDIGFAMEAEGTEINADFNTKGLYCGACHDGKRVFNNKIIFAACADRTAGEEDRRCGRCHSYRMKVEKEHDFKTFTKKLPQKGLGSGIDWEEAEAKGLIKPVDSLEGISIKRSPLKARDDFSIESKGSWMSDVIFSHNKHVSWNGCEICHPDIFQVKRGATKYTMIHIYSGEYCGVCHGKVAFPLKECGRCHTKPVQ
ncbi:MAG: hypothetical protein C4526_06840 [Nitrospiraceae bacterium]|nr:MAG: hypothetical protein C4526_06840 [Nitrospiraceae bacterium]